MARNKKTPQFSSYEEAGEWLDTHSTADLETTPAHFELAPDFRVRIIDSLNDAEMSIPVDLTLSKQISQIARKQGVSIEVLVNRWMKEKVSENLGVASA